MAMVTLIIIALIVQHDTYIHDFAMIVRSFVDVVLVVVILKYFGRLFYNST